MKKIFLTLGTSAIAGGALAQEASPSPEAFSNDPMFAVYVGAGAVVLLLILVITVTIYTIKVLHILTEQQAAADVPLRTAPSRPSWWKRFLQRVNAAVPVEREAEIELGHSYDGIRELDNHLPPWWKWLFYGSIAWGVVYFIVYHVTHSLPLSQQEYQNELAMADEQVKQFMASQPKAAIDENTLEYTADPALIEKGKGVFTSNNCAGCHRGDGGGNTIGPNLTDQYWLHGGGIKNIFRTIRNGVVEKGMPAWGKSMSMQDVRDVAYFVMSLQGTKPPDAKAPQGDLYSEGLPADSLKVQAGL
ncbi:MAG TPA: cbb3-type cytochrome c oxidase N-terminal domain-containing protein [Chryseosolibacter sp.]